MGWFGCRGGDGLVRRYHRGRRPKRTTVADGRGDTGPVRYTADCRSRTDANTGFDADDVSRSCGSHSGPVADSHHDADSGLIADTGRNGSGIVPGGRRA